MLGEFSWAFGMGPAFLLGYLAAWQRSRGKPSALAGTDTPEELSTEDTSLPEEVEEHSRSLLEGFQQLMLSSQGVLESSQKNASAMRTLEAGIDKVFSEISNLSQTSEGMIEAVTRVVGSIAEIRAGFEVFDLQTEANMALNRQLRDAIDEVLEASHAVRTSAHVALDAAGMGDRAAAGVDAGMAEIAAVIETLAHLFDGLNRATQEISRKAEAIDDIADQTKLLALNARI